MAEFRVVWEIDVEADSAAEAAEKGRRFAVKEDTTATVCSVSRRVADSGGIDDSPIFERVADFEVLSAPGFPHFKAVPHGAVIRCAACGVEIEEAEAFTAGNQGTARDLGVNLGDTICEGCFGD